MIVPVTITVEEIQGAIEDYIADGREEVLWRLLGRLTAAMALYEKVWPDAVREVEQARLEAAWWKAEVHVLQNPEGLKDHVSGERLWRWTGEVMESFPVGYVPGGEGV